jgi:hypothetical protein
MLEVYLMNIKYFRLGRVIILDKLQKTKNMESGILKNGGVSLAMSLPKSMAGGLTQDVLLSIIFWADNMVLTVSLPIL